MADALLSPFPLEKWKESSRRAVAVGNQEVILQSRSLSQSHSRQQSRSRADHVAEHESNGDSDGRLLVTVLPILAALSLGRLVSPTWLAMSEGDSHSVGSVRGASLGRVTPTHLVGPTRRARTTARATPKPPLTPPDLSIMPRQPTILGQGQALTNATGTNAMSAQSGSHSSARSSVFSVQIRRLSPSRPRARTLKAKASPKARQRAKPRPFPRPIRKRCALSRVRHLPRPLGHGRRKSGESHGVTHGEAQAFVTRYELLADAVFLPR